jgi:hypothetical protein
VAARRTNRNALQRVVSWQQSSFSFPEWELGLVCGHYVTRRGPRVGYLQRAARCEHCGRWPVQEPPVVKVVPPAQIDGQLKIDMVSSFVAEGGS